MTQREKVLATSLLGVMLVFGGGLAFHLFVYEPVTEVRAQLEAERAEVLKATSQRDDEKAQIEAIQKINPRLVQWDKLSLPPRDPELKKVRLPAEEQKRKHQANLRVAYEAYLSKLMDDAQFRRGVKVEVRQGNRGGAAPPAKGKEPPFEQLTFGVVGEGTMENVVKLLRDFYKTPLLHHVRSVTIGLANERGDRKTADGLIRMDLTVDALLAAGGEERSRLEPSGLAFPPRVLAEPGRNYLVLERINMFNGIKAPPAATTTQPPKKPTEDRADVLRFVKLTMIAFDPGRKRWEATLYDQAKGGGEKKLNTGVLNEFTVYDKDENPMIEAKVVQIDEEHLIIQSEGKYYRLRLGDFLYPALRNPLSKGDLEKLGITPDESAKEKD